MSNQLKQSLNSLKMAHNLDLEQFVVELRPNELEKVKGGGNNCVVKWWGPGGFLDSVCT